MNDLFMLGRRKKSPVFLGEIRRIKTFFHKKKQKFDDSLIFSAGKRCSKGRIQVLVCKSFNKRLRPFPTNFWLICPHLVKLAGDLESLGAVKELEKYISESSLKKEYKAYNILHQVLRLKIIGEERCNFLRKYHNKIFRDLTRSGLGGIRYNEPMNVKCIHLQAASFLSLGFHPASRWLKDKGFCSECENAYECKL